MNLVIMGVCAQASTPRTATPAITDYGYNSEFEYIYWKVQNLDTSTVTIYTEVDDSTPDLTVINNIASNAKTATQTFAVSGTYYVIYATALASGKTESFYEARAMDLGG